MQTPLQVQEVPYGSDLQVASVALRARILREPLGLSFTQAELAAEAQEHHLVALARAQVVGVLLLRPHPGGKVQMRQVAVDAAFQSQGVGSQLVAFSEVVARGLGFQRMELHARETAVPFYLKLGYLPEGTPFSEVGIPHRHMFKVL